MNMNKETPNTANSLINKNAVDKFLQPRTVPDDADDETKELVKQANKAITDFRNSSAAFVLNTFRDAIKKAYKEKRIYFTKDGLMGYNEPEGTFNPPAPIEVIAEIIYERQLSRGNNLFILDMTHVSKDDVAAILKGLRRKKR